MKTTILIDYDGLEKAQHDLNVETSIEELTDFLKQIHEESEYQNVYTYVGINKKVPHAKDKTIDELWRANCIVRKVVGDNIGTNFVADASQAMTLDIMRSVYECGVTNIILVTNTDKLNDLVLLLKEKGITVETVFFGSVVDYDLAVKSQGFIDLEQFISKEEENNKEIEDEVVLDNMHTCSDEENEKESAQEDEEDTFKEVCTITFEGENENERNQ